MTRYVLGRFVHADLEDIWDYIAIDDIDAADRWIERLLNVIECYPGLLKLGISVKT